MHHGVRIKDSAIVSAAVLSHRYISDRFLPDKAIDLIDEAAASLRIQIDSMPTEIDQLQRRATQLEIERQALKKEDDANSQGAAGDRGDASWREIREQANALKARWREEKDSIAEVRKLKERIEQLKLQQQEAARRGEYERASRMQVRRAAQGGAPAGRADGEGGRQSVAHAEGRGGRRRRGPHCQPLDGHSGVEDARRRGEEAGADGRRGCGSA